MPSIMPASELAGILSLAALPAHADVILPVIGASTSRKPPNPQFWGNKKEHSVSPLGLPQNWGRGAIFSRYWAGALLYLLSQT